MSEVGDFLLVRIAEDERDLDLIGEKRKDWHARWLAECEAKRRIVERLEWTVADRWVAQQLAQPYADHPDYRDEWKP